MVVHDKKGFDNSIYIQWLQKIFAQQILRFNFTVANFCTRTKALLIEIIFIITISLQITSYL